MDKLRDQLTRHLASRNITLAAAARACATSAPTLSRFIAGRGNVNRRTAYRIERYLRGAR